MNDDTRRAGRAVGLVFASTGIGWSSYASRIPQVRDGLSLTPAGIGLVMLAVAVGSLVALPTAGTVVHRLGAARAITIMSRVYAGGMTISAIGVGVGTTGRPTIGVTATVIGLLAMGFGNGAWDVAMNVEAAVVEQRTGRSIMPRFHAGFSIGTVVGGLFGALMNLLSIPVMAHLLVVSAVIATVVPQLTRTFLPAAGDHHDTGEPRERFAAWKERRTLLIGVFVLTMAFTEGTGNDWLGVAAVDGFGTTAAMGSLAYVAFVAAMTLGRWFGPPLLDRHGRVLVLRSCAASSLAGLLIVVTAPNIGVALLGVVLWGVGASLGFPVGMSAASDQPAHAAARVSVVATIGYVAFLAGPPLIGVLADHVGILRALTVTAGLLGVGLLAAGATRPEAL